MSTDPERAIKKVHDLGFPTCQLVIEAFDDATVAKLRDALAKYKVEVTSAIAVGPPPEIYDFYKGPLTIGLVPRQYREARIERIKQVSDFAKKAGISGVQTHCGFLPENPNDPLYTEAVKAIRTVAAILQTERPDIPLRDRPGDADHAGARHQRCRPGQCRGQLRRGQFDPVRKGESGGRGGAARTVYHGHTRQGRALSDRSQATRPRSGDRAGQGQLSRC